MDKTIFICYGSINHSFISYSKIHSLFMNVIPKIYNALFFDTFDSMPGSKTGY